MDERGTKTRAGKIRDFFDPDRLAAIVGFCVDRLTVLCEKMHALEHSPVHSDPEILGGTVVFRGTRVPAQHLLEYIDSGEGLSEFLRQFPTVNQNQAEEFLKLVREDGHP